MYHIAYSPLEAENVGSGPEILFHAVTFWRKGCRHGGLTMLLNLRSALSAQQAREQYCAGLSKDLLNEGACLESLWELNQQPWHASETGEKCLGEVEASLHLESCAQTSWAQTPRNEVLISIKGLT